jgi:hypothetical protein
LAFHLPYYALRESSHAIEDPRRDMNNNPLRHYQDVSFLDWNESRSICDILYEAQVSCVVAGRNEWIWDAYCFVDAYFDQGEGRDSISTYEEETEDYEGLSTDPLTRGEEDTEKPIWDPRIYFLLLFRIRLEQVKTEWQKVVEKVWQSVRHYERVCLVPTPSIMSYNPNLLIRLSTIKYRRLGNTAPQKTPINIVKTCANR